MRCFTLLACDWHVVRQPLEVCLDDQEEYVKLILQELQGVREPASEGNSCGKECGRSRVAEPGVQTRSVREERPHEVVGLIFKAMAGKPALSSHTLQQDEP